MKRIAIAISIASLIIIAPAIAVAQNCDPQKGYCPLTPLPGLTQSTSLVGLLQTLITISISVGAILAVLMIVIGGFQWMVSEAVGDKEQGKERIRNAILGLLILLGSFLIIQTINPSILSLRTILEAPTISQKTSAVLVEGRDYYIAPNDSTRAAFSPFVGQKPFVPNNPVETVVGFIIGRATGFIGTLLTPSRVADATRGTPADPSLFFPDIASCERYVAQTGVKGTCGDYDSGEVERRAREVATEAGIDTSGPATRVIRYTIGTVTVIEYTPDTKKCAEIRNEILAGLRGAPEGLSENERQQRISQTKISADCSPVQ